jgi:AcrR family transcriptional regulator
MAMRRSATASRDEQREATRSRLYDAALSEFRQHGFAAAQIDRIVGAAGVARGTFYFHFPSKEHVLLELKRRSEARIVERLTATLRRPRPLQTVLTRVADAILAESEAIGADLQSALLSLYVRELQVDLEAEPMMTALTGLFAAATARGEVRRDIEPSALAVMFLATVFGFFKGDTMARPAGRRAYRNFISVFVRGIAPSS